MVKCKTCGQEGHVFWQCPNRVKAVVADYAIDLGKAAREADRRIVEAKEKAGPVVAGLVAAKLYAPPGKCGFCDARRQQAKLAMRRNRARKRGGG